MSTFDLLHGGTPRRLRDMFPEARIRIAKTSKIMPHPMPSMAAILERHSSRPHPALHRIYPNGLNAMMAATTHTTKSIVVGLEVVGGWRKRPAPKEYQDGYYADEHGFEVYQPVVFQLPSHKHERRFVGGYEAINSDMVCLSCLQGILDLEMDEDDAWRTANHLAKWDAQQAYDEDVLYQAAARLDVDIDDLTFDLRKRMRERGELIGALHEADARGCITVPGVLRNELRKTRQAILDVVDELRDKREERSQMDVET